MKNQTKTLISQQLTKTFPDIIQEFVTPEDAKLIVSEHMYNNQRPQKDKAIKKYREFMQNGDWDGNSVIRFGRSDENTKWRVIDGQHRMKALAQFDKPMQFHLIFDSYKTERELAAAYGKIDRGVARTESDIVHAFGSPGAKNLTSLIAAVKFIHAKFNRVFQSRLTPEELNDLVVEWKPYADKFDGLVNFKGSIKPLLRRYVIFAFCIYIIRYGTDHEKVNDFISGIAKNDGLSKNDPRRHFIDFISKYNFSESAKRESITSNEYAVYYMAELWNKFYCDKTIERARKINTQSELAILGLKI